MVAKEGDGRHSLCSNSDKQTLHCNSLPLKETGTTGSGSTVGCGGTGRWEPGAAPPVVLTGRDADAATEALAHDDVSVRVVCAAAPVCP